MEHIGEIIALVVAMCWTATALFADMASHRLGALTLNLIRMVMSLIMLAGLLLAVTGYPYPAFADGKTWFWLALSGLVGYVFGDFCLFNSYIVFGARYGQLFMTLAPPVAGIAGWMMFGETLSWKSWIGVSLSLMAVQYAKAGIASTLMALTPVLIIIPYAIMKHQRISFKETLGTIITVTGVALFFLL